MVLFPPPFRFVFDISNLLSYIQNISSNELARPVMGTIFLVYVSVGQVSRSSQSEVCLSCPKMHRQNYVVQTSACSMSDLGG